MAGHQTHDNRPGVGEPVTEYLAARDSPCASCGQNLRGVTLGRCPECGMPLDLDFVRDGPARDGRLPLDGSASAEVDLSWAPAWIIVPAIVLGMIAGLTALIDWLS